MRERSRRRGPRSPLPALVLVVGAVLVAAAVFGSAGMGTASFDTGRLDRGGTVGVTDDETAAHRLDVADAVHVNATSPLVNVTNRLGTDVTVTVSLRDDSTHVGDLVVHGAVVGNRASFDLDAGATRTVAIAIPDDDGLAPGAVYFHANASGGTVDVRAPDRSAPVN